jgi:predicted transcriptional regulator
MPNPLLSVRIPPELEEAIEQRATFMGWTKSQVVIDLLANGLALEERRDDGMKHQSLNLGQSEADKTNQKDSAELNKLWSELEALKQQMAQLHARQLQCETTRDRFAALEASLLGSITRSN